MRYLICELIIFFLFSFVLLSKTISPLDYGLKQARTGEERFKVLYLTHELAKKNKWNVSYKGVKDISIEIPSNAKSIPLSIETNFYGVTISVKNSKKDNFYLFELSQDKHPISVPKKMFSSYDFRSIKELKHGSIILVVEDQNPWVENRKGYKYGANRKDILLLKNGIALNKTIASYNNTTSSPSCKFVEVTEEQKKIMNITLKRTKDSTSKTLLVKVMNMNNVLFQGITIITPIPHNMTGDSAIGIFDCTNIFFKQITINQTYSKSDYYGYGINMNNVWNSWFNSVISETAWGVFGNNNINTVHVSNSKINRFDTHCYGRNFYFSNCEFSLVGLLQSSFMGDLQFLNCTFNNAYVCTARTDYNAFTPFNISIIGCVINFDSSRRCLIYLGDVDRTNNKRQELQKKNTPSIYIKNTTIVLKKDFPYWSLIHLDKESGEYLFDSIGDISIDGVKVVGSNSNLMIYDRPIRCINPVKINIKGLDLVEAESYFMSQATNKNVYNPTILFNVNKDGDDIYTISDSKLNYNPIDFPHYNLHFKNCLLGKIRYYDTNNGEVSSRRRYDNCVLYLNDIDTDNYTLDDDADYKCCIFRPVDKNKKVIPYTMKGNTSLMTFKNCSSDATDLFGSSELKGKNILKSYRFRFK